MQEAEGELANISDPLSSAQSNLTRSLENAKQCKEDLETTQKELIEYTKEAAEAQSNYDQLTGEDSELQATVSRLEKKWNVISSIAETKLENLNQAKQDLNEAITSLEQAKAILQSSEEYLKNSKATYLSVKTANDIATNSLNEKTKQKEEAIRALDEAQGTYSSIENSLAEWYSKLDHARDALATTKKKMDVELKNAQATFDQAQMLFDSLQRDAENKAQFLVQAQAEKRNAELILTLAKGQLQILTSQLQYFQKQTAKSEATSKALSEAQKTLEKAQENYSQAQNNLEEAKKNNLNAQNTRLPRKLKS